MASDKRIKATMECTECKRRNYTTVKSKVNTRERLELSKFCPWSDVVRRCAPPLG